MKNRMILLCASLLCSMSGITLNAMEKPATAPSTPTSSSAAVDAMTPEQRQALVQRARARRLAQEAARAADLAKNLEAAKPAETVKSAEEIAREEAAKQEVAATLERKLRAEKIEKLWKAVQVGWDAGLVPLEGLRQLHTIYTNAKAEGKGIIEVSPAMATGLVAQVLVWGVTAFISRQLGSNAPAAVLIMAMVLRLFYHELEAFYVKPVAPVMTNGPVVAVPVVEMVKAAAKPAAVETPATPTK